MTTCQIKGVVVDELGRSDICCLSRKRWNNVQAFLINISVPRVISRPLERASTETTSLNFMIPVFLIQSLEIVLKYETVLL